MKKIYLGDLILWCLATDDRVPFPIPGGFGARFGFPWFIIGFADDEGKGVCGKIVGDGLTENDGVWGEAWMSIVGVEENSVDLFGKMDIPVLLGITSCGEAFPFDDIGEEEADELLTLFQ